MNLIIGILGRPKTVDRDITTFSKAITDVIISYDHIPLGIIAPTNDVNKKMTSEEANKLHQIIDLCDGVILQGGTDYYNYDLEAIKYIYEKNIPLLGICLGMQSIGVAFGGKLSTIANHSEPGVQYVHSVKIDKTSKLYSIFGKDEIMVNSRHKEMVIDPTNIKVVGVSNGVIESIEKNGVLFLMGVQWHPEDMINYDKDAEKLFNKFFECANIHHLQNEKL
jgi:gamma-glutamyl-gamma-aminobutyrate hydrolase PuuD